MDNIHNIDRRLLLTFHKSIDSESDSKHFKCVDVITKNLSLHLEKNLSRLSQRPPFCRCTLSRHWLYSLEHGKFMLALPFS